MILSRQGSFVYPAENPSRRWRSEAILVWGGCKGVRAARPSTRGGLVAACSEALMGGTPKIVNHNPERCWLLRPSNSQKYHIAQEAVAEVNASQFFLGTQTLVGFDLETLSALLRKLRLERLALQGHKPCVSWTCNRRVCTDERARGFDSLPYRAFSMTKVIDCYWVGAGPSMFPSFRAPRTGS